MEKATNRNWSISTGALPALLALGLGGCTSDAEPEARIEATGAMTIDGERIELANAIVEPGRTGFDLSLTDRPLPDNCAGASASFVLFEAGEYFTGVEIDIPYDDGPASASVVVHETIDYLNGRNVFSGTHEVTRGDGMARGSIRDTGEVDGREVSLEIDYAVPTDASLYVVKPTISGSGGAPVEVYKDSIEAFFDGDLETLRAIASEDMVERMNRPEVLADPVGTSRELVALADLMFPQRISVDEVAMDGDTATLTVSGESDQCGQPMELATGTVEMKREDGRWRIGAESWEAGSDS